MSSRCILSQIRSGNGRRNEIREREELHEAGVGGPRLFPQERICEPFRPSDQDPISRALHLYGSRMTPRNLIVGLRANCKNKHVRERRPRGKRG